MPARARAMPPPYLQIRKGTGEGEAEKACNSKKDDRNGWSADGEGATEKEEEGDQYANGRTFLGLLKLLGVTRLRCELREFHSSAGQTKNGAGLEADDGYQT